MKKVIKVIIFVLVLSFCFTLSAFALTDAEVQSEVDRVGKDTVTGNILVWFLCAIAFLKVSQKIDSFMASIGINVGHTGGSLLAEALITARGIGMVGGIAGGKGFSTVGFGKAGQQGSTSAFKGGLAGMVGRKISNTAVRNANGSKMGGLGGRLYDSSLAKGGGFANSVIGNIANGDVRSMGTISGESANAALMSYMGYTALGENADNVPSFSNVEIGGGRIVGTEVSHEYPDGISFAMYSADKYDAPEDSYTTVAAADGTNWYKQYAQDTIVQRPFEQPDGFIDRGETIEKRMPHAPHRKDR